MNKRGIDPEDLPVEGMTEDMLIEKALSYVSNHTIAIDGGANKGSWTVELAKRFKKVYAFEPHAGAFYNLCRAIKHVSNAQPIEQALGHEIKEVSLHTRRKVEFTDSYVDLDGEGTQMVTLDHYKFDNVGLIKLDLEGFEYFALQGAKQTIQKCSPVIIIESIPKFDKRFGLKPRQDLDYLESLGYVEVYKQAPNRVMVKK